MLLAVGLLARRRTRAFLERITSRFGSGEVTASVPVAVLLMLLGIAVASLPFWLL